MKKIVLFLLLVSAAFSVEYRYDNFNRVIEEIYKHAIIYYTYDKNGNICSIKK